jgi:hypothetical protein
VAHYTRIKSHDEKVDNLKAYRGKVSMLIMGQCTLLLKDKLRQDILWATVDATPKDLIELLNLIERVVLKQLETDQYPWATIHEADMAIKNLCQGNLTDQQWVDRMRTRWEIAKSVGVERFCTVWVDYCARQKYAKDYDNLTLAEQKEICDEAEERYVAYLIVIYCRAQHENLHNSLQEDFAKKVDKYPKTIQEAQVYLDKFPKKTLAATASEGTSFAQKGGKGKGGGDEKSTRPPYDKKFFADKKCFECNEIGHPADRCPNKKEDGRSGKSSKSGGKVKKKKSDNEDDASVVSSKKLEKGFKSIQKTLAQVQQSIAEANEIYRMKTRTSSLPSCNRQLRTAHPRVAAVLNHHKSLSSIELKNI